MCLKRLALAALTTGFAAAQPSGTAALAGKVIQAAGREPVRKAAVTLMWHGVPESVALALTDGNGRFVFERLPAGRYTLNASRNSSGSGIYGGDGQHATPEFVTLADGERRDGLVIRLSLPASVSGTVCDAEGDPVQQASVELMIEAYPRGVRQLMNISGTMTNSKGEYQLQSLQPGRYYVALGSPGVAGAQTGDGAVFRRQYYGGTADWKRAAPVRVGSGQQVRGIDLRVVTTHAVQLSGRVTGAPAMPPDQNVPAIVDALAGTTESPPAVSMPAPRVVNVQLHQVGQEDQGAQYGSQALPPQYTFQLDGVIPGTYRATASLEDRDGRMLYSRQTIEVSEQPSEIELALQPAVDIKGTLRYEGDAAIRPSEFQVQLVPGEPEGTVQPGAATVQADGTFTIAAVSPGIWDINAGPLPKGGYLKSMQLGKQDVLTEDMEIGPGPHASLNIVISSRGGRMEGEVEGAADRRRPATIMLAPTGKFAGVMSFFALAESDADGKFTLSGLTPGKYRLFAFSDQPQGDFRGPDLVEKMAALGTPVEVVEGETKQVRLKAIAAEQLAGVLG